MSGLDATLPAFVQSAATLGACCALGLAAWPLRHLERPSRKAALLPVGILMALLPALQPAATLWPRIVVSVTCTVMAIKLIDLHAGAAWWRGRRISDWLGFLVFPYILVPRAGFGRSKVARGPGKLLRAVLQIAAGVALLWLCFRIDWRPLPFLLEHTAKLGAIYLCAFDGKFMAAEAAILLCGYSVLPLTDEPIAARTPADFWRRYNCEVSRFLREDFFKPVGGLRRPVRGILAAFAFSATLHEYLSWLVTGRVYGYQLAYFALQGVAVAVTYRWRPQGAARSFAWFGTLAFEWATAILFFANVNRFWEWYAAR
jgi:hypothetical protein